MSEVNEIKKSQAIHDGDRKLTDLQSRVRSLENLCYSAKEVLNLDTGDLLVLDRTRMSPVPLMVAGQLKAEGQVIVIDKRLGVRIKKLL